MLSEREIKDKLDTLENIINKTEASPVIVNPKSSFVVVTYWWGRGNLNQNTARPCVSFYEPFFNNVKSLALNFILSKYTDTFMANKTMTSINQGYKRIQTIVSNMETLIENSPSFRDLVRNITRVYILTLLRDSGASETDIKEFYTANKSRDEAQTYNDKIFEEIVKIVEKTNTGDSTISKETMLNYLNTIKTNKANDVETENNILFNLMKIIEKCKERKSHCKHRFPENYEVKTPETIEKYLRLCTRIYLSLNRENFKKLANVTFYLTVKKKDFLNNMKQDKSRFKEVQQKIEHLIAEKNNIITAIKKSMGVPIDISKIKNANDPLFSEFNGKSLNTILNENLGIRYQQPLRFEEMIKNWEDTCRKNGCNYLAVEYPEFAKPGGYQMAINAKPLFIRKALELCPDKNVLYIDGDMTINKYPEIFDMPDVDFMARGWWIDPRSSYRYKESILIDPYTFETSGGTMFFSQSIESKGLINAWIHESHKPYQFGKADDRILSLVFNSFKFLLNMKVVQLPIEYLWLTLDYDERMIEYYDYDYEKMRQTIFIEHPECLTTEDTAMGAGASSDRTPKFYNFLTELTPITEEFNERIIFSDEKYVKAFDDYIDYLKHAYYIDDGNELLYKMKLVDQNNPENNEQPFYVCDYTKGFCKRNETAQKYTTEALKEAYTKHTDKITEHNGKIHLSLDGHHADFICVVLYLLKNTDKDIIYHPSTTDPRIYNYLMTYIDTRLKRITFGFYPANSSVANIFKPIIDISQPILFRSYDKNMEQLLITHNSMEELSEHFNNGAYEFLSTMRIAYLQKHFEKKQGGSSKTSRNQIYESEILPVDYEYNLYQYIRGLDMMYSNSSTINHSVMKTRRHKSSASRYNRTMRTTKSL